MSDLEMLERLALAAVLGAVLGFEREWRQKDAGLKTNILIAVGAALFTVMSIDLSISSGGDATRIASQVVTGIGFLGAGAILRTGAGIRGLTTAAMIWVNAAIGVAVGGGEYRLAIIATAVALTVLLIVTPLERVLDRRLARRAKRHNDDDDNEATGGGPSSDPSTPERGSAGAPPPSTQRQ